MTMDSERKKQVFFWTSPIIGFVLQYIVLLLIGYLVEQNPQPEDQPAAFLAGNILYLMAIPWVLAISYLYLWSIKRFRSRYCLITYLSMGLVIILCICFFAIMLSGKDTLWNSALFILCGMVWISLYFIPIYWAAYLHVGKNR